MGDLLCLNFTLEGETLVPQRRRPFRFLAEGFLNGESGMVEAAGIEPASRNPSVVASTCVVRLFLRFACEAPA